ncbi:MAG: hypothetical protein RIT45_1926 [Pseudomonadota bacterium]
MSEERTAYRQILRATSLFGGVQVFQIAVALARSKAIAVLLGPTGMGIGSLYTSTLQMIGSLTGLGLQVSAVKDIAASHASGDEARVATVVTAMRRWVWATGLLGLLVVALGAPWLSELVFEDSAHTMGFVVLSATLLFTALTSGRLVLLQGTRQLKRLAAANVAGATLGLLAALPLYFWLGEAGIVAALLVTGLVTYVVAEFIGRSAPIRAVPLTLRQTVDEGRSMVSVGVVLMLNGVLFGLSDYLLRLYLRDAGGTAEVGLYSAATSIMANYVGMVFTAMSTDYYPRLSGVMDDKPARDAMVNQQAEIALLILGPILVGLIVTLKPAVLVLYSSRFLAVEPMMQWQAIGVLLKAASWPIGFLMLSGGQGRLFLVTEIVVHSAMLGCSVLGHRIWGLQGVGIGYLAAYGIYWTMLLGVVAWRYQFRYGGAYLRLLAVQSAVAVAAIGAMRLLPGWTAYAAGFALLGVASAVAWVGLDRRIGIGSIVARLRDKIRRRLPGGGPS